MSQTEVIDTIASALSESAEEPTRLIREIVEELGGDAALALLDETRRIEEAGGMVVARGNRRRSPGGVFFKLAKDRLPKEARKRIFRSPQTAEGTSAPESQSDVQPPSEAPPPPPAPRPAAKPAPAPTPPRPQPPAPRGMPEVVVTRRRIIASPPIPQPSPSPRHMGGTSPRPVAGPAANVVDFRRERPPYHPPPREPAPPPEEPRRPSPPVRERVLVRVAPQSDLPAKTLDEAIERIGRLLSELDDKTARAALLEMIDRKGGLPVPEPEPEPEPESEPEPKVDLEHLKQSILVKVVRALGLEARDLATVLYGDDSPGARRKARTLLGSD